MKTWTHLLALLCLSSACTFQKSSVKTVEIPETSVKNQGNIGICWSYALTGLLESRYKVTNKKDLDLSEEAIYFYFLAEQISNFLNDAQLDFDSEVSLKKLKKLELEGFYLSASSRPDFNALKVIEKYGVVPESAWSFKIDSGLKKQTLLNRIRNRIEAIIEEQLFEDIDPEYVMKNILVGKGLFPVRPPSKFIYENKTWDTKDYLSTHLAFKENDYETMDVRTQEELVVAIERTKKSLHQGYAVPLGFPLDRANLKKGIFKANDGQFRSKSRHLVLITDYKNIDGSFGAMDAVAQKQELEKNVSVFDAFFLKNSWGFSAKENESGAAVEGTASGYYVMEKNYLESAIVAKDSDTKLLQFTFYKGQ